MTKAKFIADNIKEGELYAGLILGKDGEPDHHLFLLPGTAENITWLDAKSWAVKIGGELPTPREQALLFANLKEEFEPRYYWSCEQHESSSSLAWSTIFYCGSQLSSNTSYEGRARAVRRLEI